jgi:hypothetical protein
LGKAALNAKNKAAASENFPYMVGLTKFERKLILALVWIILPYTCAAVAFVFYVLKHPGPVPQWTIFSLVLFFVLTLVIGSIVLKRVSRREIALETSEESKVRCKRASRGLKAGLIVYSFILLNDIRMALEGEAHWSYAIVGISINILIVIAIWKAFKRSQSTENSSKQLPKSSQ